MIFWFVLKQEQTIKKCQTVLFKLIITVMISRVFEGVVHVYIFFPTVCLTGTLKFYFPSKKKQKNSSLFCL